MKRFVCTLMALAMTMALALSAFAGESVTSGSFHDPDTNGETRNLTGTTKTPIIKVYIPLANTDTDKLILNPYALPVTQDAIISGGSEDEEYNDQIISKPLFLGSLSDVPLNVSVKVVATPTSTVTMSSKSVVGTTATTKSVFIWGQVVDAGTGNEVPEIPTSFASEYDATEGKSGSMILLSAGTAGVTRSNIYQIPAAEDTDDAETATWACMRFLGDAVKAPTTAWTINDKVSLAVTFTFTASMNEA